MIEIVAYLGCVILAALAVFQAALIAGAPIGRFAWGGNHAVLPTRLRIGSAVSIILYAFFAVVLLSKSGITELIGNKSFAGMAIWVVAVYFILGIFMNAASRSKQEQRLMTPTALILAIVFLFVAIN